MKSSASQRRVFLLEFERECMVIKNSNKSTGTGEEKERTNVCQLGNELCLIHIIMVIQDQFGKCLDT
jgi:hypothetical protein